AGAAGRALAAGQASGPGTRTCAAESATGPRDGDGLQQTRTAVVQILPKGGLFPPRGTAWCLGDTGHPRAGRSGRVAPAAAAPAAPGPFLPPPPPASATKTASAEPPQRRHSATPALHRRHPCATRPPALKVAYVPTAATRS